MDQGWTSPDFSQPFVLLGTPHLVAVAVALAVSLGCAWLTASPAVPQVGKRVVRWLVAAALIGSQLAWDLWNLSVGFWNVNFSLPLHLCSLTQLLCAVMLLTNSRRMFEVLYYWGLAGGTQAMLTPEIGRYGFPHVQFWCFFVAHGAIWAAVAVMLAEGNRPGWGALGRTVLVTNLLLPVIALVNWLTGANYWFIARPPATASLIDFLGPWPWYILSLQAIGIALFVLLTLPWVRGEAVQR